MIRFQWRGKIDELTPLLKATLGPHYAQSVFRYAKGRRDWLAITCIAVTLSILFVTPRGNVKISKKGKSSSRGFRKIREERR